MRWKKAKNTTEVGEFFSENMAWLNNSNKALQSKETKILMYFTVYIYKKIVLLHRATALWEWDKIWMQSTWR